MNRISQRMMKAWAGLGTRYLPFADAASDDVPLERLLRLSLFQVSAGMTLVLLVGTLNRVMIVELGVPASLVAVIRERAAAGLGVRAISHDHALLRAWADDTVDLRHLATTS